MDTKNEVATKITVDEAEVWTRPFGDGLALIMTNEEGVKQFLYGNLMKYPEYFDALTDDCCEEDLDGMFAVIVDPQVVQMIVMPGCGRIGFRIDPNVQETEDHGDE